MGHEFLTYCKLITDTKMKRNSRYGFFTLAFTVKENQTSLPSEIVGFSMFLFKSLTRSFS